MAGTPDLSPIEHLWDVLDRRIRRRDPRNADLFEKFLLQEWEAIHLHEIQIFVWSVRRHYAIVVNANGGHTQY